MDTIDWGNKWIVGFNAGKAKFGSFEQFTTLVLLIQKCMDLFLKQNHFCEEIMLGLSFSPKLNWGSYTVSIAKTAFKKMGPLIHSMNFFPPEAAIYFYKAII